MFTINCRNCGEAYHITGITKEEYEELHRTNPETCDACGEII